MNPEILDQILALQFRVAWAGETPHEEPRLGWWRTDVIDEDSGGDFMRRLAPRTHRWAALESAREAARRCDRKARYRQADPDGVRTLFFWGFELDEMLADRLRELKQSQAEPPLEKQLPTGDVRFTVLASGREIWGPMPTDLVEAAQTLVAALCPHAPEYPAPFFRVKK